jgi:hypothetical protein
MFRLARCLLPALLATAPALAETAPGGQAAADLDTLRARAAMLGDAADLLRQVERFNRDEGGNLAQRLRELLGDRSSGSGAIFYRDASLVALAAERAQLLASVLSADLDNDGTVTRGEVARVLRLGRSNGMLGDLFLRLDGDADDRVTETELAEGVIALAGEGRSGREDRSTQLGRLIDFDDDGQITPEELDRTVAALVVRDAPIEFSPPDTAATSAAPAAGGGSCAVTRPSEGALVQLVSAYEGHALSSVSIGGQDRVTQTADLVIEPGDTPLYLVLGSFELVIWRITGAVDRVERVVVQSAAGSADIRSGGVTGLPAEKVSFVASAACFPAVWDQDEGAAAAAALAPHLGRPADTVFADYTLASLALPSRTAAAKGGSGGEVDIIIQDGRTFILTEDGVEEAPTPEAGAETAAILRELTRFYPGGVVEVDAASVVSAHPVEPYVVQPQAAGLMQLMEQGLIRRQGQVFLIARPIPRFPAGLHGAHGVSFVLAPGVPVPPGDPGHSSLRDATGACLSRMCR